MYLTPCLVRTQLCSYMRTQIINRSSNRDTSLKILKHYSPNDSIIMWCYCRYELKHSEFVVKPPGGKLSTKGTTYAVLMIRIKSLDTGFCTVRAIISTPWYFHEFHKLFWIHEILFVNYCFCSWWFLLFLVIALVTCENMNIQLLTYSWKYNGMKITMCTALYC